MSPLYVVSVTISTRKLRLVAHLVVDVQVVLERVAASGVGSVVSDKRDIVGVRLARAGAAHDEIERLVVMGFRCCCWTSVSCVGNERFGSAHLMGLLWRLRESFQVVKVDAAAAQAFLVRSKVRDSTRTSWHEQMLDFAAKTGKLV